MDLYQHILLSLNAIISAITVIRLITYERHKLHYNHSWLYAIVGWLFIINNATLVIRVLTGDIMHIDLACVINNLFICALMIKSRGNIRLIFSNVPGSAKKKGEGKALPD